MTVIWSISAVVFIGGCLTLKYATRPVLWAYEIGRIVGRYYAARQARREWHRNCFAEADVTQLIRTLADAISVLEAHGIVPVDPRPRPDLWLVPYFGQPGSSAPSWNLSAPDRPWERPRLHGLARALHCLAYGSIGSCGSMPVISRAVDVPVGR